MGIHKTAPGVHIRFDATAAHVGHDCPHLPCFTLPAPSFSQLIAQHLIGLQPAMQSQQTADVQDPSVIPSLDP